MKCSKCNGKLLLKDKATYIYSYEIKEKDETGKVPYLFYNREQTDFKQFIQCEECKITYELDGERNKEIDFTILQKAIRSSYETTPPYFA